MRSQKSNPFNRKPFKASADVSTVALARSFLAKTRCILKGSLQGKGRRIAIVVSRFNLIVTQRLLLGALDALHRHGVAKDSIDIVWVPGAFEIPQAAWRLAQSKKRRPDAVVCLGTVIRGQTPHYRYICDQAAHGISSVAIASGIPVTFGVLTTDTLKQALDRAGGKHGNKGWDAALSALEMANVFFAIGKR